MYSPTFTSFFKIWVMHLLFEIIVFFYYRHSLQMLGCILCLVWNVYMLVSRQPMIISIVYASVSEYTLDSISKS